MKRRTQWMMALITACALLWGCDDDGGAQAAATDTSTSDTTTADTTTDDATTADATEGDTADALTEGDADADDPPPTLSGSWRVIDPTADDPATPPEGAADVTATLSAGQVRAGQVKTPGQIPGFDGRCRPGDFKLYNDRAAFCIEGATASSVYSLGGGNLIDASPIGADGRPAPDALTVMIPELGLRTSTFTAVEVVRDGSDGLAVVRATGHDDVIPYLLGLTGSRAIAPPGNDTQVVTEYRLRPDSAALEVITWISHPTVAYGRSSGDLLLYGDTARYFFDDLGLIQGDREVPNSAAGFETLAPGVSSGVYVEQPGDILYVGLGSTNLGPGIKGAEGLIPPGLTGAFSRVVTVGDGSTFSAHAAYEAHLAATRAQALPARIPVTVEVQEASSGAPLQNLLFEVFDAAQPDRSVGAAYTDAVGVARFDAPPGSYTLRFDPWDGGDIPDATLVVEAQPVTAQVEVATAAHLPITVTAEDTLGQPLGNTPAKVWLRGPVTRLLQITDSGDAVALPPGTYAVEVSRGFEYSAWTGSVTLTSGDNAPLAVTLTHHLPTPGLVGGEFHQHAAPSPDSDVSVEDRVMSNVADGVDFMAPSDHDQLHDYNQTIAALGVRPYLLSLNGSEVSPTWGHINGISLTVDPAKAAFGALPLVIEDPSSGRLRQRKPLDIVRGLKQEAGASFVQLNHGRQASQSILAYVEYDPAMGLSQGLEDQAFIGEVDMIELFNGRDATCNLMRDWYSLLDQGRRVLVVGNSDTHNLNSPAGFPRNYVGVADDDPAALTADTLTGGMRAGDVTIAGGALIRLGDGWRVGEDRSVTPDQPFTIPVTVQSPPWSRTTTLLVIVNGHLDQTITFDPAESDLIDFEGDVTLTLSADAHVHFIAFGVEPMSAVYSGAPYSVTNALFFDVDGDTDGDTDPFEPAGVGNVPATVSYLFCDL
jgi:hypothetical protein